MNRRNFLQWTLGTCAFTALQRSEVVQALEALPDSAPPVSLDGAVSKDYYVGTGLSWKPPVGKELDLPQDAEDGEARWVMDSDCAYIWVAPVGWVVFAAKQV